MNYKCLQNGINHSEMKNNPEKNAAKIHYLETFFNGFPAIMHMDIFTNLTELKIVNQELKQMWFRSVS